MILVDTSVWIGVLRDKTGKIVQAFQRGTASDIIVFCRFVQLELLQGAKGELEWRKLDEYLSTQYYLEMTDESWSNAAKIYFDLRKRGETIRSPIDCCIAQIAIDSGAVLLHNDQDFEKIADISPLKQEVFVC
ncbi:MAG: PIN domain nuclease [Proteobacteria bacterium]|nr:PIN domain nuclease [Pseudomonadota bacterium]